MKNLFLLLLLGAMHGMCFSQTPKVDFSQPPPDLDSLLPKIRAEKNDSARYYLVLSALTISETNPVLDMYNSEKIVLEGRKTKDPVCLVLGLGCLGYDYRAMGNNVKSLQYNLEANKIAEASNNDRLVSFAKGFLAINYLDLRDYKKAIVYGKASVDAASRFEMNVVSVAFILDMGMIYLADNRPDSALIYTQKAYEASMTHGINYWMAPIFMQFAQIHAINKTPVLALSFMRQALAEAQRISSPKYICLAYTQMAGYYFANQMPDSAEHYAKKSQCRRGENRLCHDVHGSVENVARPVPRQEPRQRIQVFGALSHCAGQPL